MNHILEKKNQKIDSKEEVFEFRVLGAERRSLSLRIAHIHCATALRTVRFRFGQIFDPNLVAGE